MTEPIGREQVRNALMILQKYKQGKASLEARIIANEQWYRLRHWDCLQEGQNRQVRPVSGWLFNSIANKHADAMDSYPGPNILPREAGDMEEARMLSAIIPVILQQDDFEQTYSDVWDYKLKAGTGVYGCFWDKSRLGGLGDISIRKIDLLSLFWEPGKDDIQSSRHLFHVELADTDELISRYPQLEGKSAGSVEVSRYVFDDTVDTSGKTAVVDWYYKKHRGGRTVLHYCKFAGDQVLFATENQPELFPNGWYDHGLYPFIFDPLFRVEGSPCGFSYIDVGKSAQEYIDRGNQAILQNMLSNVRPRHFIRSDGSVNEEEYADMDRDFIHVDGNLGQDSILPVKTSPLGGVYVTVLNNKIEELKETTGNRDISTGGTASGVTAASAIAAMQEAGSKLSRDGSRASYRAYRRLILMIIELIRQFYNLPRCFRILGADGGSRFISYCNQGLRPQHQGSALYRDLGYRLPVFDVEVTAQKQSPYSKMGQNELALQFYHAGFFNPQMAEQALACLDMMDFDRKEFVMEAVRRNARVLSPMQSGTPTSDKQPVSAEALEALGGGQGRKETSRMKKERQRVADAPVPD